MREIYRILDANFNRAREALRVCEDCGRFALNDPAVTAMAKNLRSNLQDTLAGFPADEFIASRDTPGDIGTEISSPTEQERHDLADVATAACKRLSEALRSIEEYAKVVAPDRTLAIERMRYNAYTLEQRLVGRIHVAPRMADVKLYVIISSVQCAGSLKETARAVIAGGADAVQLREKNVPDYVFLAMAAEIRELTDETGKIFIIDDRPDIAAMVGADGVHLGQHDLPIAESRTLLRPGAVIGRSIHSVEEVPGAVNEGPDYVSVGSIFPTDTKADHVVVGLETLRKVVEQVTLPVVAIGGITAENAADVIAAGASCVAVSSAICRADDPKGAAAAIKEVVVRASTKKAD